MAQPGYPQPRPPKPPIATTDLTISIAALVLTVGFGLVVTVLQLHRRKPGWPFAVATFVLCALAVALGGIGYAVAVGA
jgi:hypothetical protein